MSCACHASGCVAKYTITPLALSMKRQWKKRGGGATEAGEAVDWQPLCRLAQLQPAYTPSACRLSLAEKHLQVAVQLAAESYTALLLTPHCSPGPSTMF